MLADQKREARNEPRRLPPFVHGCDFYERTKAVERELLDPVARVAGGPFAMDAPERGAGGWGPFARALDHGRIGLPAAVEDPEREHLFVPGAHERQRHRRGEVARLLQARVGEDDRVPRRSPRARRRERREELGIRRFLDHGPEADLPELGALTGVIFLPLPGGLHPSFFR